MSNFHRMDIHYARWVGETWLIFEDSLHGEDWSWKLHDDGRITYEQRAGEDERRDIGNDELVAALRDLAQWLGRERS